MNYAYLNYSNQRIRSLDLLRGFAILGILIMNIISFSNVGLGYVNPTLGAGLEGYNKYVHAFSSLFADTRFMSIFSILFGAGIVIFARNAEVKNKPVVKLQYRRMFFLLLFGFIHAYLIWMGDILVAYAICGSLVFLLRKLSIKALWRIGVVLFIVPVLSGLFTYFFTPQEMLAEIFSFWEPSQQNFDEEIMAYTGSYMDQMTPRIEGALELQTMLFFLEIMWRASSMMILGIILMRKSFLSASKDFSYYKKCFLITFSLGLFIAASGLYRSYDKNWEGIWIMNIGNQYKYIASALMAVSYMAVIMIWSKSSFMEGLKNRLEAVGKMALTNYILSSVICTFIFYGHGLSMFAKLDRLQCLGVVLIVWLILLFISPLIISKYRQGPLEKLWRRLTYGAR